MKKIICLFLICFTLAFSEVKKQDSPEEFNVDILKEVAKVIKTKYVEKENISYKKLLVSAIKGMLDGLDAHSGLIEAKNKGDVDILVKGSFGGVGIEIAIKNKVLTVIAPIEDTPAFKAGLKPGDKIIRINGVPTVNLTVEECVSKIRGTVGTFVELTILRTSEGKSFVKKIKRDNIKVKTVKKAFLKDGKYGYIRITSFNRHTSRDLIRAIDYLKHKSKILKGLVIDLRATPGGLLESAIECADYFLPKGRKIVSIGNLEGTKRSIFYSTTKNRYPKLKLAVLVNNFTASAAEILAAALGDNEYQWPKSVFQFSRRAIVIGQTTFGKGSVQELIKLLKLPKNIIKLTVSNYFTPTGTCIQNNGYKPHIKLDLVSSENYKKIKKNKDTLSLYTVTEKDLPRHLKGEKRKNKTVIKVKIDKKDIKDPEKDNDYTLVQALKFIDLI